MELRVLILLGLCVSCIAVQDTVEGSGSDIVLASFDDAEPALTSDFTDFDGSGDDVADIESDVKSNVRCASQLSLDCWCVYRDGTEVPKTRAYATKMSCKRFGEMMPPRPPTTHRPSTATESSPPSRPKAAQPDNKIEVTVTQEPVDDITYEEEPEKVSHPSIEENSINYNLDIPLKSEDTGNGKKSTDMDNSVPKLADEEKPKWIDETEEELTNEISGSLFRAEASLSRSSVQKAMVPHPGILAALIGGGVVLLLCAVLIILFIIYRVRKKDEGSYPLGDEKPLKNYAYSKAPSREFFA